MCRPLPADESSINDKASTGVKADRARHRADTARTERLVHGSTTRSIIAAFYAVYDKLGFGFLENVYCAAPTIELRRQRPPWRKECCCQVHPRYAVTRTGAS